MSNLASRDDAAVGRERWSWRFDFLVTNIGFVACFGNLWRFPYLCYANGGAAFLIPYLLCAMFLAIPLLFLEMALGQYTSLGGIKAWKICPLFQGIGVATTVVTWWRNIYYNVILAWTLYYLYSSCIGSELPWARCNHEWNTATCLDYESEWVCVNGTYIAINKWNIPPSPAESSESDYYLWWWNKETKPFDNSDQCGDFPATTIPAQEFWKNKVLRQSQSDGIHDMGGIVGHLALTLFLAWTLVYFCLWKGVKWSGKVAYFTAPFIHVVFIVLVIRGATLHGAYEGLLFYLFTTKDLIKYTLKDPEVWLQAGTEVLYSFSIGLGAFIALGSYNKFHYNFYRDSMIVAFLNLLTSIYGGLIVFTFIGFVAQSEEIPVNDLVDAGPGLFFTVFPRAFAEMPMSRVWSIFFYFVVLMIGLNTQLITVKAFITAIMDMFPKWLRRGYYKELFVLGVCFVNFLIGLTMVTEGGIHVFTLFDVYGSGSFAIIWICFFETIAIGWVYGVRRFSSDIAEMLKWQQIEWYIICWPVTVPLIAVLVWIVNIVFWTPLHVFEYPRWADGLGYCMAISSMLCIPGGMVYAFLYEGSGPIFTRLKMVTQPSIIPVRDEEEPNGTEMAQLSLGVNTN